MPVTLGSAETGVGETCSPREQTGRRARRSNELLHMLDIGVQGVAKQPTPFRLYPDDFPSGALRVCSSLADCLLIAC